MAISSPEQLFEHARKFATPFRTSLGYPWALVPDGGDQYRGFAVLSHGFEQWLKQSYHSEHSIYPTPSAIETAAKMFDAQAQASEMPEGDVFTRIGWRGDRDVPQSVLLRLGNLRNELVEITPNGRRIVSGNDWQFVANSSTGPLPRPVDNRLTLRDHLRRLLDLQGVALDRAVVWLFSALRPSPPYPVLLVSGPAGSGKTTLLQMVRSLIDPSMFPTQELPAAHYILFSQALHNHVVAYDESRPLPHTVINWLMRLASGNGLVDEAESFEPIPLGRPVILTSTSAAEDWMNEGWMRNVIGIDLTQRNAEQILSHETLAQKYVDMAPAILGTLCDAVTAALSSAAIAQPPGVARFEEAYRWSIAAAPALGLTPEQINCALADNRLVDALNILLQAESEWTGTISDLVSKLQDIGFGSCARNSRQLLNDLGSTNLATFGIYVEHPSHAVMHMTKKFKARIRRGGFRIR